MPKFGSCLVSRRGVDPDGLTAVAGSGVGWLILRLISRVSALDIEVSRGLTQCVTGLRIRLIDLKGSRKGCLVLLKARNDLVHVLALERPLQDLRSHAS